MEDKEIIPMTAQTSIGCIPIGDRIYVKEDTADYKPGEKRQSGIFIPDDVEKAEKCSGTVVAIGAGFKGETMTLRCGDRIRFSKFAGSEDTIDGVVYKTMREPDVFCILIKAPAKPVEVTEERDGTIEQAPMQMPAVDVASESTNAPEPNPQDFLNTMQRRTPTKKHLPGKYLPPSDIE